VAARGEHLKTPNGVIAVADGGTTPKVHDGWMWDLTIPGDHDFYIQAATTDVLVHNCPSAGGGPREWPNLEPWNLGKDEADAVSQGFDKARHPDQGGGPRCAPLSPRWP
jgi:hypothetical protein